MLEHPSGHLPGATDDLAQFLPGDLDLHAVGVSHGVGFLAQVQQGVRDAALHVDESEVGEFAGGLAQACADLARDGVEYVRELAADLVEAFIELMGLLKSSSRIDVVLGDDPEAFERVSGLIRSNGGEVISVGISGKDLREERTYFFRLEKCDVKVIASALQEAGYKVVSFTG